MTIETAPLYRLKIEHDQDARNPREEGDYADIMYCEHRNYRLGDEDADKPVHEESFVELVYQRDTTVHRYRLETCDNDYAPDLTYESVLDMLEEHHDALDEELADATADGVPSSDAEREAIRMDVQRAAEACRYLREAEWESEWCVNPGIAIIRDLSLYDHSGITIFAGAPTCRWDSGQVGWQYITDEALQSEWKGDRDAALRYMDATLKEYDDYLRGNVYGFTVEKGTLGETTFADGTTEPTIRWDSEDSCWGFIGDWSDKDDPTGMREHLPREVEELFDSLDWSDEGKWRYTANVPDELRDDH